MPRHIKPTGLGPICILEEPPMPRGRELAFVNEGGLDTEASERVVTPTDISRLEDIYAMASASEEQFNHWTTVHLYANHKGRHDWVRLGIELTLGPRETSRALARLAAYFTEYLPTPGMTIELDDADPTDPRLSISLWQVVTQSNTALRPMRRAWARLLKAIGQ
jgi:hypothetical protein